MSRATLAGDELPGAAVLTPGERMRRAKILMGHAAAASLANDPLAEQMADDALQQLEAARDELRRLGEAE